MDSIKRSKFGSARSLLHRVHSSSDVHREEDFSAPPTSDPTASTSTTSLSSHQSSPSQMAMPTRQTSTKHRPHPSTSLTISSTTSEAPPSAHSPNENSPSSATATNGASIEQSVRLFRVFEALRSGDTAAISKAMKETSTSRGSNVERTLSSVSLGSSSGLAGGVGGPSILHLAVQCAELPVIEYVLSGAATYGIDINSRDRDGNTPLHIAASLGRAPVVRLLLDQKHINDSIANYQGRTPLDLARNADIYQQLQLARSVYIDNNIKKIHSLVAANDYDGLEKLLVDPQVQSTLDVNAAELATDPITVDSGGTLLHEAARKKDMKLIQLLLLNGADPFHRDRKGKLPQDVTKDDRTRAILKKSPAAAAAQRGIQEKSILGANAPQAAPGSATGDNALGNKESREMKGYLKKWTNYTGGYKLRWFVLEDGVLSYYKHQDDAGSACRGAINMRIATLHMDPQDKTRFEIHGKSSVKYHLKANHQVEAKRWYWALNNAIQWTKDEAKSDQRRQIQENELLRQAKLERVSTDGSRAGGQGSTPATPFGAPLVHTLTAASTVDDDGAHSIYAPSVARGNSRMVVADTRTAAIEGDADDEEEYGDDASSHEGHAGGQNARDAFNITAQSARIQLDLMSQVSTALQAQKARTPTMQISDPSIEQALSSYEAAVGNLKGLIGDLLRIARDRDAYWQYRLDREANIRRMWEDSMAKVAKDQEELQSKIGESEDKRRRTKRALREVLENQIASEEAPPTASVEATEPNERSIVFTDTLSPGRKGSVYLRPRTNSIATGMRRKSTIAEFTNLSDSESDIDEEFFDAVDAGEVEVVEQMPVSAASPALITEQDSLPDWTQEEKRETYEEAKGTHLEKKDELEKSYRGYEDPVRKRLNMDADNRPKISLWGILKSMIGKDMTKMTLPVSFNEPTSLLQRVAEDMEYTELLDVAAERSDPTERMVYVAGFAISEYASTIGRVAKPFNPLLGETYEYVRPDKGYRFFIEQVSHHPPIGAAWAESRKWDYYGESAVKSKFYGKSFDINPLGTWFLRLRPTSGSPKEEVYTWKKVTSSVIGIITGNPTVDNYGPMEVRNHTTGEVCLLDFKPKGWKASSAYQVSGKIVDADGKTRWSIGGRWNDKIYARLTPGYEEDVSAGGSGGRGGAGTQAHLVWQAHPRPPGIPFNLTPFVVTLNALPERLRPYLPPTDTRLRPDQRAMEDGEYDRAATEKNRLEEKQRAKRREREAKGEEFVPRWFEKRRDQITGEEYWHNLGEYWRMRERVAEGGGKWEGVEDIF